MRRSGWGDNHQGGTSDGAGYSLPEPYPHVEVTGPNQYYARILLEDTSGKVSEMTAVTQYSYHNFVFEQSDLRTLLHGIAIVEMNHLDLLSRTIKALGGDPRYRGYDGRYWNGDLVYYGSDIVDRITADIAAEKLAIQQYQYHQSLIADPNIQNLLERIIKDELYHITLFQKALNKYNNK